MDINKLQLLIADRLTPELASEIPQSVKDSLKRQIMDQVLQPAVATAISLAEPYEDEDKITRAQEVALEIIVNLIILRLIETDRYTEAMDIDYIAALAHIVYDHIDNNVDVWIAEDILEELSNAQAVLFAVRENMTPKDMDLFIMVDETFSSEEDPEQHMEKALDVALSPAVKRHKKK